MTIQFINLTKHIINEVVTGLAVPPSGTEARVSSDPVIVDTVNGINVYQTVYGDVVDLPVPVEGVLYLVSGMVLSACPNRTDLLAPGELVRDSDGKPVGCKGFRRL